MWIHVAFAVGAAWVATGVLRQLVGPVEPEDEPSEPRRPLIGTTEIAVVLGALDLLFLVFVLVQLRYYVGGSELVEERTGLTYAEYARDGFFELVAVAALALAVLLLWVAVVLGWLGATVLRGRRDIFTLGALVAGLLAIVVLNALNPDGLIARSNIDRASNAKEIDISYLGTLSGDAAPTLAEELQGLARRDKEGAKRYRLVAAALLERWDRDRDWRTWSLGRQRARDAVLEHETELRALARLTG